MCVWTTIDYSFWCCFKSLAFKIHHNTQKKSGTLFLKRRNKSFRLFVFQANLYWFGNGPTIAGGRGSLACHLVMPGFMGQAWSNSIGTKEVQLYKGLNLRSCQWSRYIDFMRLVEQLQYGILPFVLHNLAYPDCTCYQWLLPLIYHVSVKTAQIHGFEWFNFVVEHMLFPTTCPSPHRGHKFVASVLWGCGLFLATHPHLDGTTTSNPKSFEPLWSPQCSLVASRGRCCSTHVHSKCNKKMFE